MRATKDELTAAIQAADRFLLLTHRRPDGDTLGSAAALCRGLRAGGKPAYVRRNPAMTERYQRFLDGLLVDEIPTGAVYFSVDVAAETMLADNAKSLTGHIRLGIDHHGSNAGFAAVTWVVPEYAACGEAVMELLERLDVPLTQPMADALYLALATDTGGFRYSNTTPNTLRRAAALQEAGAGAYAINRQFLSTKSLARLRLETMLGQHLEVMNGGRLAICSLTPEMMTACGATEDDIEDLANFPRQIDGVQVAVYIRMLSDGTGKISVRTDPGIDAAAICARLGGGGHVAAAGATVAGDFETVRQAILGAIHQEVEI